jgi:type II secretory pathway pseudopilin PulG
MFQRIDISKSGFTLVEILLSTGIGLLLILFVLKTFLDYQQMALKQRDTARIQATFQRILMMMKSELIQAGYGLDSYQEGIKITDEWIQIQKDGNLDGDLGDSREDIVYRFFPDDQKLSRKSGQGYFQILLEPIYFVFFQAHPLDFESHKSIPCVRIRFQLQELDAIQEATLCPLNP